MTLPNVLLIGAAKAGTTSLWNYLGQHPDVYMSPDKEPRYFCHEDYESSYPRPPVRDRATYENLFAGVNGERAVGEASTHYLVSPLAACRIAEELPGSRLFAVLRHPAERAWSSFLHNRRHGKEPITDLGAALDVEHTLGRENWDTGRNYQGAGLYHFHLSRYQRWRDQGRLLVLLYDDFVLDPLGVCREVFEFIDVDPTFAPDMSVRHNSAVFPSRQRLDSVVSRLMRPAPVRRVVGVIPQSARTGVLGLSRSAESGNQMPMELRERLLSGTRDDTLRLQEMLGRDLSAWLR